MPLLNSRWEFDSVKFMKDFDHACIDLGVSPSEAGKSLSVYGAQLTRMRKGERCPNLRVTLALAVYVGLDLKDYLIDLDAAPEAPSVKASWTFSSALERIKQLEEELKRAKQ